MPLFHHILFPVDFSKRNTSVAMAVSAMAKRNRASLTLLHSFELPVAGYADAYAYVPTTISDFQDAVQSALDRFAAAHFDGLPVRKVVQCGAPVESIVDFVNHNSVDLVMMASHGRSRFRSLLLGSVTAGVLHDAHCPVWTDSHSEEIPPALNAYEHIVCAIDLTPKSAESLRFAKRVACENRACLHVVHSEPSIENHVYSESASQFRRFLEFRAKEEYEPLAQQADVRVPLEVISGPIGESIAGFVKRGNGDLLVIGRGVIEERVGRLRTSAYDIIRSSPCPVLSV